MSVNISKSDFIKMLNAMKQFEKENQDFLTSLSKHFGCVNEFKVGQLLSTTIINYLEEQMNDEFNTIEWWLYDNSDKVIYVSPKHPDNKSNDTLVVDVSTPSKLYDYFVTFGRKID